MSTIPPLSPPPSDEYHLRVYADRSELILPDGFTTVFAEGATNAAAKQRYKKITDALDAGFLREQIRRCREEPQRLLLDRLEESHQTLLDGLVDAMTSEVGRALIGLSVLQITVKAIEPTQSIRLHKGSSSAKSFGWRDGISLRSLDTGYITPVLREEGLVKLNVFGFMMTRTLAENYPYTRVYKAAMRGARAEWLALVEGLEAGTLPPLPALHYLLSRLLNHAAQFEALSAETLRLKDHWIAAGQVQTVAAVTALVRRHMVASTYAARILEIVMHTLMQSLQETGALGSATVVPLSQMRSANKKHGNIGDIELKENSSIVEAWDAKYGKTYLRDELEELSDKLESHDTVAEAGFVTSEKPEMRSELSERITELREKNGVLLRILVLEEWVEEQRQRAEEAAISDGEIAQRWLTAYAESLALKRPLQAPIDEPCYQWLAALRDLMRTESERFAASIAAQ